ncbi:ABC transporter ATP-binding protein [Lactococcus hodotermopsidis]|uniref:ABC transporter ATP-binding protein n=1 Tax=Pseudolactococcus hodotermopsidis TaxID=2709157 RepID=A0A6A0BBC5_9LACT|nr:dipeptide/oligopeptide/nickel ABC transporter ATP-binding protein [Lactococcus hodotermopsidis]GFH42126.1 ABC transporter ATP-binding protein [Lactococcus hodotermopsidis]
MKLIQCDNCSKFFDGICAFEAIDFSINRGEIISLIGESGSGKSTIAECISGIKNLTTGKVTKIANLKMQYIFQNPGRSFNPKWQMGKSLLEPLKLSKKLENSTQIDVYLDKLKLDKQLLTQYPHECSGGQKQRLAIIRAILCEPDLIIADEVTSGLDSENEQELLKIFKEISLSGVAILFITHNIKTIENFSDQVIVLKQGKIVEKAITKTILDAPKQDYTQKLLAASHYFTSRRKEFVRI